MTGAGLPDWRDAEAYGYLRRIDRAGLMWEWLRRDPGYVAWYASASRSTRASPQSDVARAADDWGLHFR